MKRYCLILMSIALLSACTRENIAEPSESFFFKAGFEETTETKTHLNESLKNRWDADDRVSIFVGNTYNQQFKFDGATGDDSGSFSQVGNPSFVSGGRLPMNLAVYPYSSETSVSEDGTVSFMFPAAQEYAPGSFGLGANTMVAVTENTSDNFLLFKNACGYLKVSLYGDATVTSITLRGNDGEKIAGSGTISVSFSADPVVSMSSSATDLITLGCGDGVKLGATAETATDFYLVIPPVAFAHGFTIKVLGADGSALEKSTAKSVTIPRNTVQRMAAIEYQSTSFGGYDCVDLGLPSGIKWATMNVGATKPEEYGDYFAWGATEPWYEPGYVQEDPQQHWKSGYSGGYTYANTPYQTENTTDDFSTSWKKYLSWSTSPYKDPSATVEDAMKTVLDPEDDAAHVNWGGSWRMPTDEEWKELKGNCSWTASTINGIKGTKVQSNKPGYTDKWIFIPHSGLRHDTVKQDVGSCGYYWSSSIDSNASYQASSMFVDSGISAIYPNYRCQGLPVRPVLF